MLTRNLGRTGIAVSEIGFGCGPTAGLMVYGTPAEQAAAVARACDLGISYFDTAPIYGEYVSEENLGRALQSAGVRPHLATKVALELPDLEDIPRAVRRSVEDSLRRLRTDHVTLIQLHNRLGAAHAAKADLGVGAVVTVNDVLGPILTTLEQLRHEGKAAAIGCCAYGGDPALVRTVMDSGRFDTVLVGYSLLNPTAGRVTPAGFRGRDFGNVLAIAEAQHMSGIVLKVLESGALSGASQPHPTSSLARRPDNHFAADARRAAALQFLARPGQTMVQAAIRFALQDRRVGVVLVGFSAIDQLEEAVQASDGDVLNEAELLRVEQLYGTDFGLAAN